jgi:hypothetical protein
MPKRVTDRGGSAQLLQGALAALLGVCSLARRINSTATGDLRQRGWRDGAPPPASEIVANAIVAGEIVTASGSQDRVHFVSVRVGDIQARERPVHVARGKRTR